MRKSNAMKAVLNRIENLARKEYRDIVGQLEMMISVYEKTTGVTSKRPYTKKELATTEAKPPQKVVKSDRPAFKPVSPEMPKIRKVRKDKGQKRGAYTKRKQQIPMSKKLVDARKKLEQAAITV